MLIKICGITTADDAVSILQAGADFIGFVHYPPSKRHVSVAKINALLDAAETYKKIEQKTVLVVADLTTEEIVKVLDAVNNRLDVVQIHRELSDEECADIAAQLEKRNRIRFIRVIQRWETAQRLLADPPVGKERLYLLELSHGSLPGGNGKDWDWQLATSFCAAFPTLLAGGITLDNVRKAIQQAHPLGIDLSSGVETVPGQKDIEKVEKVIRMVH